MLLKGIDLAKVSIGRIKLKMLEQEIRSNDRHKIAKISMVY